MSETLSRRNFLKGAAVVGGTAVFAGGLITYASTHETNRQKDEKALAEAKAKQAEYDAPEVIKSIETNLTDRKPLTFLNGSVIQEITQAGQKATRIISNPIVRFHPDDQSTEHTHETHFFEANQHDGTPAVTEVVMTSDMKIAGPASSSEILYFDAVLKPAVGKPEDANKYVVDSIIGQKPSLDPTGSFVALESINIGGR